MLPYWAQGLVPRTRELADVLWRIRSNHEANVCHFVAKTSRLFVRTRSWPKGAQFRDEKVLTKCVLQAGANPPRAHWRGAHASGQAGDARNGSANRPKQAVSRKEGRPLLGEYMREARKHAEHGWKAQNELTNWTNLTTQISGRVGLVSIPVSNLGLGFSRSRLATTTSLTTAGWLSVKKYVYFKGPTGRTVSLGSRRSPEHHRICGQIWSKCQCTRKRTSKLRGVIHYFGADRIQSHPT
ncbi:unnamed protein product [Protopolystoma xenopodis]|uniref:Uncharacterized protein n=1 Tax=Protopolystoma xenopodis TaxID=117903 RepID=A0A448WPW5_9PLAT|nr:unnamed protein product [Protopolystoma xenopodis]